MARKFVVGDSVKFKAGAFEKTMRAGVIKFLEPKGFYTILSEGQNYTIHGRYILSRGW